MHDTVKVKGEKARCSCGGDSLYNTKVVSSIPTLPLILALGEKSYETGSISPSV
jgi:hypothetical protein